MSARRQAEANRCRAVKWVWIVLFQGKRPGIVRVFFYTGHRAEPYRIQASPYIRVLHESIPHSTGAVVFNHDDDGPLVDADYVGAPPIPRQIEGVAEAIRRPELRSVGIPHLVYGRDDNPVRKWDLTDGCRRDQRSIVALGWGSAPRAVSARGVRSGDSPQAVPVAGETARICNAVSVLCERRTPGVLKIINSLGTHIRVGNIPEIDPAMRVLMSKQRRKYDVRVGILGLPLVAAGPRLPSVLVGDPVCGRAVAEDVDDHRLVIADPLAVVQES